MNATEPPGATSEKALRSALAISRFVRYMANAPNEITWSKVPEVVDDGVTGFVRDDLDALVGCVEQLGSIRRQDCRDRVERLYSEDAVVSGYLDIYREILDLSNRRLK